MTTINAVQQLAKAFRPTICRPTLMTLLAAGVIWFAQAPQAMAQSQVPANDNDTTITITNPPAVNVPSSAGSNANAEFQGSNEADDESANATSRWPMRFEIPQGVLTVYQPQLTDFENNTMRGRAAVSIKASDADEPVFGAIWLASRVLTDRAARTVKIIEVKVERVRIPDMENIPQEALGKALTQAFERQPMNLSLDQLISMVERVEKDAQAVKELSDTPPTIKFINNPAMLVQFDGEPRFTQTDEPNLLQAVNTPFFIVLDKQIKRYYLKGAGRWYIARDAKGPYLALDTVPGYVTKLAKDTGYIDPEEDLAQAQLDKTIDTPAIIIATEPTELVWTIGPEELSPIENTNLLFVTNTDSDIILDIDSQKIYLLLSGRWYRSSTRTGPWEFVAPDTLPADFAQIPTTSDKGSVLAHVSDTQMAKDAIADNYVPQTASIDRSNYEQPRVQYDGDPRFEQIERMRITYAVNSPNAVLRIDGRYYVCHNAVWYESNIANGPWELSTSVPREVYLIPPTSPVYSVRYVRIYEVTPTVVYTGYLPGYVGSYVHNNVVVYGTGYRYSPWVGHRYYPRPATWGFTPRYDPYHAYWGFNAGVNINFGNGLSLSFGTSNRYVASRSTWFGYGGYRPTYIHPRHYPRQYGHARYRTTYNNRHHNNRNDYRTSRDRFERQSSPRRADLNLYERRRDVIGTHTPGRAAQTQNDRADRINQRQNTGGLTAHQQRLDKNNNGRVDRNELPSTANNNSNNRPDRTDSTDRADRNNRTNQADRADRTNSTDQRSTRNGGLTSHEQRLDTNNDGRVDQQERTATNTATRSRNDTRNNDTRNNVFADQDGNVYRKTMDGWERRDRNQWIPGNNPEPVTTSTSRDNANTRTRSRTLTTNNGRAAQTNRDDSNQGARSTSRNNNSNNTNRTNSTRDSGNTAVQPNQTPTSPYTGSRQRDSRVNPDATNTRSQRVTPGRSDASESARPSRATSTQQQRIDPTSKESLNADYRARIMGEQRQQIYNRTSSPAQPAASPSPSRTTREPAAQSSRTTTRKTSKTNNARNEAQSAEQSTPGNTYSERKSRTDDSNDSRGRNRK